MAQAALVLPESYLNASIEKSQTALNTKSDQREQLHEFRSVGIFQLSAYLKYNEKGSMTFSISDNLKSHYILIKGLLVFCRSKDIVVRFNLVEKTITADLHLSDLNLLKKLLEEVSMRVHDELKFKTRLKQILEFERRYKEEALLIYKF